MPDNHTAPGCMLRFDVQGTGAESTVTIGFTYADITSADPVVVRAGAAVFTDSHRASKVNALYAIQNYTRCFCPCTFANFLPASAFISGLRSRAALHALREHLLARLTHDGVADFLVKCADATRLLMIPRVEFCNETFDKNEMKH
jgi:hypothetical protein